MEGCPIMKRWRCSETFRQYHGVMLKVKRVAKWSQHNYMIQMMAWLEQERLEGEREIGEGDTYVVYQVPPQ